MPPSSSTYYLNSLTGVRFIAALYVFLYHIHVRIPFEFLPFRIKTILSQGALGVNVFFILSGFILTYSYGKKLRTSSRWAFYREFILKRLSRIYPVYLVGFFASILVSAAYAFYPEPFGAVVMFNTLMIHSYIPSLAGLWYGGGSWSISTEFFFYFTFPLLLPCLQRVKQASTLVWIIVACAVVGAIPGILFNKLPGQIPFQLQYSFPPFRLPEFVAGVCSGLLVFKFGKRVKPIVAITMVLVGLAYLTQFGEHLNGYTVHNFVVIPTVVLLLMSISTHSHACFNWLSSRPMVYLGKVSYTYYIVQLPLSMWFDILMENGTIQKGNF